MPGSDSLVIVLDPGHGGENEGLKHKGLLEKDMNLVVANAMRDELLQYDNAEVYITNPEKTDMSLKQRAEYAESVGADILISLHFNMSEAHEMYGSEVWIPSRGMGYAKMHSLGDVFMEQFGELGFTLRGVKTRLNDDGLDYYGVIRESTALGIPAILVEHGYADHEMDYEKVNDSADWELFGRSDATAVAKYYGLKSSSLGRDYSSYIQNGYYAPEEAIGSDLTQPEGAVLIYEGTTAEGENYSISAWDDGSRIVYYDYSIDGGKTWSEVLPFETGKNVARICIEDIQPGSEVIGRIYNGHFLYTETNHVFYTQPEMTENKETETLSQMQAEGKESWNPTADAGSETSDLQTAMALSQQGQADVKPMSKSTMYFSLFGILMALLLIVTAFATYKERMKRKRMGREARKAGFMPLRRMRQIENICLVAGICALLVSVTVFGVSFAQSRSVQTETVMAAKDFGAVTEDEAFGNSEEIQDGSDEEHEPEYIPQIDVERSEGYVLTPDNMVEAGDELFAQMRYNEEAAAEKETVVVYDIAEGYMRVPLIEGIERCTYDMTAFSGSDMQKTYHAGDGVKVMRGIDVSKFQGNIDWQQVKEAGVEFAILRLGFRGYGSGELQVDAKFHDHYSGAAAAGIKVGVYFFSAAISDEEARQEADFVADTLQGLTIDMPVVYDTELILDEEARTHDLTPNQITSGAIAFCDRIREIGYRPMIYSNAKRFTTVLHLEKLEGYEKWLADYREAPDYPYAFRMWQYTEKGSVPGISGSVDMNLYFYEE